MTIKARFDALYAERLPQILSLIDEVIVEASPQGASLVEMCRYQMRSGGKRLRALLPLLVAESLGEDPSRLIPFGAACEVLHNATLVHDDLQDGDTHRRGVETIWRRYGEAQAINLGDAMFYYPMLLLQRLDAPPRRVLDATARLTHETLRVVDGQEREFALMKLESPTLDDYFAMVEGKTSGLFALPMAGAAQILGADPELVAGLEEAARHLGVLFQIQDDVLDLYADKGRGAVGSDIKEGKRSALAVRGLSHNTPERAAELKAILDKPRDETTSGDVGRALELLDHAGALPYALDEIERRRAAAVEAIAHPALHADVAGIAELFLAPIQGVRA